MMIDNFKILKSKYYIIGVDTKNLCNRHIIAECSNQTQADHLVIDFERADKELYNKNVTNYYIVKGNNVKTWFNEVTECDTK